MYVCLLRRNTQRMHGCRYHKKIKKTTILQAWHTNLATGRSSIPATIGTSGRVGPTKRPIRMVIMLCWCSACSVFSSRARFFFMNDQRCSGFLKRHPSQNEIQSPSRQPTIPASHACQKLTSPPPISAPRPAIITVPAAKPVNESKILTQAQALDLLRKRGYTITDSVSPPG